MSMILDAIKRSKEGPEGVGSVPSLDTEHYVAPDRPIWKKAVFKRASLAALGVMVVVLLFCIYPFAMDQTLLSLRVVIQRRRLRIRRLLILLQQHPRTSSSTPSLRRLLHLRHLFRCHRQKTKVHGYLAGICELRDRSLFRLRPSQPRVAAPTQRRCHRFTPR